MITSQSKERQVEQPVEQPVEQQEEQQEQQNEVPSNPLPQSTTNLDNQQEKKMRYRRIPYPGCCETGVSDVVGETLYLFVVVLRKVEEVRVTFVTTIL